MDYSALPEFFVKVDCMKFASILFLSVVLAACGVETLSTAATTAVARKQEADQAKATTEAVRQQLELVQQQNEQRLRQIGEADK